MFTGLKDFLSFSCLTGIAGYSRPAVFIFNAASGGLPSQELTFAKIAKQECYETALVGTLQLSFHKLLSVVLIAVGTFMVVVSDFAHLLCANFF